MTRALADRVFPIDETLVSEDLWLTRASEGLGEVRESPQVVLNYRIHPGNSNPRNVKFAAMSQSLGERNRAWGALLKCDRFTLSAKTRRELSFLEDMERLRLRGRILTILVKREVPFGDRAAYAAGASASLFWLRKRLFRLLSGRRSR